MARKKDSNRKNRSKAKRAKKNVERKSGQAVLLDRLRNSDLFPEKKILVDLSAVQKMSEVILDFAEPLLSMASNDEEIKKSIGLAILIWNLSLLPTEGQSEQLEQFWPSLQADSGDEHVEDARSIVASLLKRKELHFQDHKRAILDYHISDTRDGLHLDVVSTVI